MRAPVRQQLCGPSEANLPSAAPGPAYSGALPHRPQPPEPHGSPEGLQGRLAASCLPTCTVGAIILTRCCPCSGYPAKGPSNISPFPPTLLFLAIPQTPSQKTSRFFFHAPSGVVSVDRHIHGSILRLYTSASLRPRCTSAPVPYQVSETFEPPAASLVMTAAGHPCVQKSGRGEVCAPPPDSGTYCSPLSSTDDAGVSLLV